MPELPASDVASTEALGGQVITLGPDRGYLNVLDPGEATAAAERLPAAGHHSLAAEVLADAHGRRNTIVAALLTTCAAHPPPTGRKPSSTGHSRSSTTATTPVPARLVNAPSRSSVTC